jgi:hypothetical protein
LATHAVVGQHASSYLERQQDPEHTERLRCWQAVASQYRGTQDRQFERHIGEHHIGVRGRVNQPSPNEQTEREHSDEPQEHSTQGAARLRVRLRQQTGPAARQQGGAEHRYGAAVAARKAGEVE